MGRRPVAGRITLDGTPLESGYIDFVPQKPEGLASGGMIVQGEYRMTTQQGIPPGKYYVRIASPREAKISTVTSGTPTDVPPPGIEQIPRQYNAESTLIAEVTASGTTRFDFDLQTKKSP